MSNVCKSFVGSKTKQTLKPIGYLNWKLACIGAGNFSYILTTFIMWKHRHDSKKTVCANVFNSR